LGFESSWAHSHIADASGKKRLKAYHCLASKQSAEAVLWRSAEPSLLGDQKREEKKETLETDREQMEQ